MEGGISVCVTERERERERRKRDSGGPGLHFRGVDMQTQLDQISICDAFLRWVFFHLKFKILQLNQPSCMKMLVLLLLLKLLLL